MARPRICEEERRFNEELGRRISVTRLALHMKAGDLAKAVGISKQSLCDYESGARTCPPRIIRRVADKLGISTGALMPRFITKPARALKSTPIEACPQIADIS